jgi:hypothetical protein
VSEYQYYEFQAIDKPLTEKQMIELRALSSRATITPTSFTNHYEWGNFKGDPHKLMTDYFDAHLYLANWGTHWFMLRFPRRLLDEKTAAAYCRAESATVDAKCEWTILGFVSEDEDGDWEDTGEGSLASLIPLRADILAGDLRCLYLGWLLCAQSGELDDEELEPTLPPGCPSLRELSASLEAFADFLRIDPDLIAVAAEGLPDAAASQPTRDDLSAWVRTLPAAEKDGLLLRLVEGEGASLRWELLKRFREERSPAESAARQNVRRRTVAQLMDLRDAREKERTRREAEEKARRAARLAEQQAQARAKHLDGLVGREAQLWTQAEALIRTKQPKKYDEAAALLTDLRDLAARQGTPADFRSRLAELRGRHSQKPSLLRRLRQAGIER